MASGVQHQHAEPGVDEHGGLREHVSGQTVVMVTHDPTAASFADRVVFLADGRVVDEITAPTMEEILDTLKRLGN